MLLWTITILLAVLWAVCMVSSHTLGGSIHVLLFAAITLVIVRLIQGRRRGDVR